MAGGVSGYDSAAERAAEEARRRAEEEARKRAEEEARKKAEQEAAQETQEAQEAQETQEAREQEVADNDRMAQSIWEDYQAGNVEASEMAAYINELADSFEFLTPDQISTVQDVKAQDPAIEQAQAVLLDTAKSVFPDKENWTDEEIVQAVAIYHVGGMTNNVATTLNSPDTYGWTGELRNSLVEFFGYDNSYEDLQKIINCQQDGMELLKKSVAGDLTQQDVYDYSKQKLATDPNYRLIEDAVDYLPYDIAVDWAQNGIPEDIELHLAVRCSDGYMGYYTPTIGELSPVDTVHVMGIIISQNNEDIYSNINQLNNDDYYVDDSYTIHYNDALEPYSLGEDANKKVDFNSMYELVQGQEFSPEKLGRYLDSAQALEYLKPSLENVTDFTNKILGAETYGDLVDVFIDYYGDEDFAVEQLNQYLHETIHPNRENFMSDEAYEQACNALASSGEFGVTRRVTDIQVQKNSAGEYCLIRKFDDDTEIEDDIDMPSVCSAASGACNSEFFFKKLDDSLRSETGRGIQDYTNEFEESFADLSGLSRQLDNMIQDYDGKEKNAVNVVAGIGTTAAVITALALAPSSGGTSLALLGATSSGASTLGTSVAIASVVGGTTNTVIRGTNAASAGQDYSFGTGVKDFTSGAIQGSVIPLSAGLFKYAYNVTGFSASYGLAAGSQTSPILASIAKSPLASTGIKFLATTTAGAASGQFAGQVTAANNYIFYNDNQFDLGEFIQTTAEGGRNGARFGAGIAFGGALISELPYLSYLAQNGGLGSGSGANINVIPGYNAYIMPANNASGMVGSNPFLSQPENTLLLGAGNTPLALSAGNLLPLPSLNSLALSGNAQNFFLAPGITPAQMSYANALTGLAPSLGVPPQATTVQTPTSAFPSSLRETPVSGEFWEDNPVMDLWRYSIFEKAGAYELVDYTTNEVVGVKAADVNTAAIHFDYAKIADFGIQNLTLTTDQQGVRGSSIFAKNNKKYLRQLKDTGINQVIDLRGESNVEKSLALCQSAGLDYTHFAIQYDQKMTQAQIDSLPDFIHAMDRGNYYIGCNEGTNRTDVAIGINYLFNPNATTTPKFESTTPQKSFTMLAKASNEILGKNKKAGTYSVTEEYIQSLGWPDLDTFWATYNSRLNSLSAFNLH